MFQFIDKNPILAYLSLCLLFFLTTGIFFNGQYFSEYAACFVVISLFLILCGRAFADRCIATIIMLLCLLLYFTIFDSNLCLVLGNLLLTWFIAWQRRNVPHVLFFAIIFTSFLLHFHYIEITEIGTRQHDLNGIVYYMRQITYNGFNFWDFDPWNMYYLFHQPLHFFVNSYIYKLALVIWKSEFLAQELLQFLSLFYATATIIMTAKILQMFLVPVRTFYAVLLLAAFNPSFFLFSGYISNDVSVLFWAVASLYYLLRWYKEEARHDLLISALCLGLGVLTKLSILILAPVFVLIFLHKLYVHKRLQKHLSDISLFIIIAVPLALIWIVRNHFLFDMDFYNIPDTPPSGQSFRYLTFGERIGDFSLLTKPFLHSPLTNDSNMFLSLIKTELFGEWNLSLNHQIIFIPALLLYFLNIVIKLIALIGCFYIFLMAKKKYFSPLVVIFAISYLIIWVYSFKYAMDYPYTCSTDYRLFATMNLPELILLASLFQYKKLPTVLLCGASCYALLSNFIYLNL